MDISKTEIDRKYLVKVKGEVDLYSSPALRAAVTKEVPLPNELVAVDLSAVSYMDSSGVATLVEGLRAATHNRRSFLLVAPSSPVLKVLQLSRLNTVFDIRDSV